MNDSPIAYDDPVASLLGRLPARPPASMDRCLDAVAACLARHGLARTSMTDVAREMGVARSTLYKQVGSVEQGAWALLVREAYRFFDAFGDIVARGENSRQVVALTAAFIRFAGDHPVMVRLLRDEPAWVGGMVTQGAAAVVDAAATVVTPLLATAVAKGIIRAHDPARLASWLGRVVTICIIAPPPGPLEETLEEMLLPVLQP